MEITEEKIKGLISNHMDTLKLLEDQRQRLVQDFQQQASANQNRFQQLTGAIAELKQLLNGAQPTEEKQTNGQT